MMAERPMLGPRPSHHLRPALHLVQRELAVRGPQHLAPKVIVLDRRSLDLFEVAGTQVEAAAVVAGVAVLLGDEVLVARKGGCNLEGVPYLPAVPPAVPGGMAELVKVLLCEVDDAVFFNHHLGLSCDGHAFFLDSLEPVDIYPEKSDGIVSTQLWVEERNVHPRFHGFIKSPWAVGREEQDARIVLEDPEED